MNKLLFNPTLVTERITDIQLLPVVAKIKNGNMITLTTLVQGFYEH